MDVPSVDAADAVLAMSDASTVLLAWTGGVPKELAAVYPLIDKPVLPIINCSTNAGALRLVQAVPGGLRGLAASQSACVTIRMVDKMIRLWPPAVRSKL